MQVDISIIIPIYNAEDFLERCIESVIHQANCITEIILIDDCSTDSSYKIAQDYAKKHNNIQLVRQPTNQKVSAARNRGIKLATGKYILFVDSDDYLKENSISKLYQEAEKENTDILFSTFWKDKTDTISKIKFDFPTRTLSGLAYMDSVKYLEIFIWNKLWKRSFLMDHDLKFPEQGFEDVLFVANAINKAQRVKGINYPFYYYRIREGSTMRKTVKISALYSHDKMVSKLEKLYINNKSNISANQYLKLFLYSFVSFDNLLSRFKPNTSKDKFLKKEMSNKLKAKHAQYRKQILKCSKLGIIQKLALFISPRLLRILFEFKLKHQ
ncbi:MAG TPA: glycosyltransferase [Flavobacteriaceae bacterium]|nr:glycosyltransferase [Flavobacteriaceae bacterium]